ncbi:L-azetidine-2-carboxylic acid acetyltransferase [Angomonas deanei]|uniref:N-acetyltransferase domain-containing protein n=1 Tax=Angomonas deanei TaxID=59799 RepID=A0A7G2CSE3_9TRYP|nr:L-azetidine-2-carboxylic acid acetyltransferase [Angomonas deanei]CAD2222107.1 hypothetical protein, conserved [Angomonas deanei]|eukprot:EPY20917.1 L-azetidine-2-carboxylic acid acetyltransferase [Angomonas deanei]
MAYGASVSPGPQLFNESISSYLPQYHSLKDNTKCILQRLLSPNFVEKCKNNDKEKYEKIQLLLERKEAHCSAETFTACHLLLNHEIKVGVSYPFEHALSSEQFDDYFFGYDTFILRSVEENQQNLNFEDIPVELPDKTLIAVFYIKPNWPGRSNHICNGGFLSSYYYRKKGGGLLCGEFFKHLAKKLNYRASIFNLVFVDNPQSMRLWEYLKFEKIAVVKEAGRHPILNHNENDNNIHEHYVDAVMWRCDLTQELESIPMPWENGKIENKNENENNKDPGSPLFGIGSVAPCP